MAEDGIQSLLESISYMCLESIEKSHQLKDQFQHKDSVEQKNENISAIKTLLARMSTNIKEFQERIESFVNHQCVQNIENPTIDNTQQICTKNEKISRLGLIKTRPESLEEYDLDLTGSVVTMLKQNITHNHTNNKAEAKREDDNESGTIILKDDDDEGDIKEEIEINDNREEFEAQIALKHEQRAEEYHRENDDLLRVFSELPFEQDCKVENAFKFMDDLDGTSTDSGDTILYSASSSNRSSPIASSDNKDNDNGNDSTPDNKEDKDDQSSDCTIDEDKLTAIQNCKTVVVKITRLDDDEIDRLCNINNIKKRRGNSRKELKYKRIRRVSSASSSSNSSHATNNSSSSTTSPSNSSKNKASDSDLSISDIDEEGTNNNHNNNNVNKESLAEMYCNEMRSDSSLESDSDDTETSDNDDGSKPKRIRNRKNDNQNRKRKRYSPLPAMPSDSDSSSDDDNLKIDKIDDNTQKSDDDKKELENITIIEDSDTNSSSIEFLDDDDSDLELIPTVESDTLNTSGRKHIRRILSEEELTEATQQARFEESQRIQRLEELSKMKEPLCSQHDSLILDMDVKTKSPLLVVDDRLYKKLKPHQKDGIKFMWEACYESIGAITNGKSGSGCILAHCMGLGKTFQAITLIHTLLTNTKTKTRNIIVMCPLSTVLNWKNEFQLAFKLLNGRPHYQIYYVVRELVPERCDLIEKWQETGGVLVIGYEAFVRLACGKMEKIDVKRRDNLKQCLTNPGPDLVICDEGHLLKNQKAKRSEALMSIKTNRKIVLTGTPLQNNLKEYYYMVKFVKPGILGTFSEYTNRFVNPIMNGQFHDSNVYDIKLMKKRTHVLNKLLKKTIHRAESSILKQYLPPILDYTLFIKLEPVQIGLYRKYVDHVRSEMKDRQFFKDYRILQYICLHPYTIELSNKENKKKRKERDTINVEEEEDVGNIPVGWWANGKIADLSKRIDYGPKIQIIFSIIDECELVHDKVLIFSHSLVELDCIEHFLKTCGTKNRSKWIRNVDYFRLDGTISPTDRSNLCNRFNCETNKTMVFLVSQKVGGLGLNLIAANRVILVSTNFNPGYDTQSVYRIYRFGQNKRCYVYRLVTMGTMEEKIYQRCVVKLSLAGTVIDKFHITRHVARHDFFNTMYNLDIDNYNQCPMPNVPNDRILAKLIQTIINIYKYNEYQALLENRPEEELNDEEKTLAWDEYNNEENAVKNAEAIPPLNQIVSRFIPGRPTNPVSSKQTTNTLLDNIRQFNASRKPQNTFSNMSKNLPSTSNSIPNLPIASTSRPYTANNQTYNYNRFMKNVLPTNTNGVQNNSANFGNGRVPNNLPSTSDRVTNQNTLPVSYNNKSNVVQTSPSVNANTSGFFVRAKNGANPPDFLLNRFYK